MISRSFNHSDKQYRQYFSGNFEWQIKFDDTEKLWKLSSKKDNSTYADYTIGRKLWEVYNDK